MSKPTADRRAPDADLPPQLKLLQMWSGYLLSRALHVTAELGIADHIAPEGTTVEELARRSGAHPQSLYRLLRALAGHGVFFEDDTGRFRMTPMAEPLRSEGPGSIRSALRMVDSAWWNACGELEYSVRTGKPAFDLVTGVPHFEYHDRHPDVDERFARGMANFSERENPLLARAYDFSRFQTVADVGGGRGGFLAEILKRHPPVRGILYDRTTVVTDPSYIAAAGVQDRCEIKSGNFLESVPAGADVYIVKRILHDWDDDACIRILSLCRNAVRQGGRVLAVDAVVPAGNARHWSKDSDLLMMALLGGRERTAGEFGELFRQAGLRMLQVIGIPPLVSIVEGERS